MAKLIAAIGMPGSGKSSVFAQLAESEGLRCFHEPEESNWHRCVERRAECGHFTALTWFRSQRVTDLFEADSLRAQGHHVLIDSYYDKLLHLYLNKEGMEWLVDPTDEYFDVIQRMAALDYERLPEADVLVLFELEKQMWDYFLGTRNRRFDKQPAFLQSFPTQRHFRAAAEAYVNGSGGTLIVYSQKIATPAEAASELASILRDKELLP